MVWMGFLSRCHCNWLYRICLPAPQPGSAAVGAALCPGARRIPHSRFVRRYRGQFPPARRIRDGWRLGRTAGTLLIFAAWLLALMRGFNFWALLERSLTRLAGENPPAAKVAEP